MRTSGPQLLSQLPLHTLYQLLSFAIIILFSLLPSNPPRSSVCIMRNNIFALSNECLPPPPPLPKKKKSLESAVTTSEAECVQQTLFCTCELHVSKHQHLRNIQTKAVHGCEIKEWGHSKQQWKAMLISHYSIIYTDTLHLGTLILYMTHPENSAGNLREQRQQRNWLVLLFETLAASENASLCGNCFSIKKEKRKAGTNQSGQERWHERRPKNWSENPTSVRKCLRGDRMWTHDPVLWWLCLWCSHV